MTKPKTVKVLSDNEFHAMLTWFMVSDPWPCALEMLLHVEALLNREAALHGFVDWVEAYHEFEPTEVQAEVEVATDHSLYRCEDCGELVGNAEVAHGLVLPRYGPVNGAWWFVDGRGLRYHWHDGDECDWCHAQPDAEGV